MLTTISLALENFCAHQIRVDCTIKDGISQKRTLIAYIDVNTTLDKQHRVYIAADKSFMQRVSKIFLDEDESDEETLIDMTLETANMIIGSAKVIAEESGNNTYTISTPHFIKMDIFDFAYDQAKVATVENDEIIIAVKELD